MDERPESSELKDSIDAFIEKAKKPPKSPQTAAAGASRKKKDQQSDKFSFASPVGQQAAASVGIVVIVAITLAWAFWSAWDSAGLAGVKEFASSTWNMVIVTPWKLLNDKDFWLDTLVGWALICVIWILLLKFLGRFAYHATVVLYAMFSGVVEWVLKGRVPDGNVNFLRRIVGTAGTGVSLCIIVLLVALGLRWFFGVGEEAPRHLVSRRENINTLQQRGILYAPEKCIEWIAELRERAEEFQSDADTREVLIEELDAAEASTRRAIANPDIVNKDWRDAHERSFRSILKHCQMKPTRTSDPFMLFAILVAMTVIFLSSTRRS